MKVLYVLFMVLLATLVAVRGQDEPDPAEMDMDNEDLGSDAEMPDADIDAVNDDAAEPQLDVEPPKAEKVQYTKPTIAKGAAHFHETFDDLNNYAIRWVKSQAKKDGADSAIAKYDGVWEVEEPSDSQLIGDKSLVLKSKAHHHAIAAALDRTFHFSGKPFILQYEVRFKNGMECGGAYVKLLTKQPNQDLTQLHDKTPYTIMFGPDKCGNDHKLHFIFRHKNPITGEFEEKHAKKPTETLDAYFTDKKTHVYRLVVKPDDTYEVSVDGTTVNEGSLLKDVEPAVNPAKEIDDPEDKKPQDWDDKQKIKDPEAEKPAEWDENAPEKVEDANAVKPEGWLDDEPDLIADPDAQKPEDWDEEMDGEWEAPKIDNAKCTEAPGCGEWKRPTITNPDYKGKWTAPFIDNPNYQGIWKPRIIANPKFFEDLHPYKLTPIVAVGLELWSMTEEIVFDNFLVTDDMKVADDWTRDTFHVKSKQEKASSPVSGQSVVGAIMEATNERPWLWAVIILVVVLPVVLIIAYCCFSGSKHSSSLYQTLLDATTTRPWLWAVYTLIILGPIFLLSFWLCPSSGPIKPEDVAAMRKKTDEASADDVKEDEAEVPAAEDVRAGGDGPKKSRGDLEADEETTQKSDDEAKTSDKEEAEVQAEAEGEDEVDVEGSNPDSPRQSPRKRKTRKE